MATWHRPLPAAISTQQLLDRLACDAVQNPSCARWQKKSAGAILLKFPNGILHRLVSLQNAPNHVVRHFLGNKSVVAHATKPFCICRSGGATLIQSQTPFRACFCHLLISTLRAYELPVE